jgi:class 3 adenylate cyclase
LLYFIFSKKGGKRNWFIVLSVILFVIPLNDLLVSNRIYNGLFLTEYGFFSLIVLVFFEFLNDDRKTYLKVLNFANDLKIEVDNKTKELREEKEKSEQLLLNVLPDQIAERLKQGEQPIADLFDEASVIFIDIVDFTVLSAKSTPQKMVNILNDVFTEFDKIAAKHGLEKIKTIGDCYMAAAGIPIHRPDHAEAIAKMAIESMEKMNGYITEDGHEIKFRVGLDCGPIVAGVIGKQKFIYDLWGDMVNTASRMETNGIIGRIQCTERFKDKLGIRSEELGIKLEERGEIEVKGKGMMKTFFIN